MTSKGGTTSESQVARLGHGIYGLIIVTATLVAEQQHIGTGAEALGLLLGTAVILFLAHTYSELVALRVVNARPLGLRGLGSIARRNLPLFLAIVVQSVFLSLAWLDAITLQAAYVVSIAYTLVALFGLGVYAGRVASQQWRSSILSGFEAAAIGIIIVVLEALLV